MSGYAVVVDHGYTFANDAAGARFTPETARLFAAERNALLREPTYAVYLLTPDTGAGPCAYTNCHAAGAREVRGKLLCGEHASEYAAFAS